MEASAAICGGEASLWDRLSESPAGNMGMCLASPFGRAVELWISGSTLWITSELQFSQGIIPIIEMNMVEVFHNFLSIQQRFPLRRMLSGKGGGYRQPSTC